MGNYKTKAEITILGFRIFFTKFWMFFTFWTVCLLFFELALGIPWYLVLGIRTFALVTNFYWDKWLYQKSYWRSPKKKVPLTSLRGMLNLRWLWSKRGEIPRLVAMKIAVNLTNFAALFGLAYSVRFCGGNLGINPTVGGFAFKVGMVIIFASLIAIPYSGLEELLFSGLEGEVPMNDLREGMDHLDSAGSINATASASSHSNTGTSEGNFPSLIRHQEMADASRA